MSFVLDYSSPMVSGFGFIISLTGLAMIYINRYLKIASKSQPIIFLGLSANLFQCIFWEHNLVLSTTLYSIGTTCVLVIPGIRFYSMMSPIFKKFAILGYILTAIGVFMNYFAGRAFIPVYYMYYGIPLSIVLSSSVSNYFATKIIMKVIESTTSDTALLIVKNLFLYVGGLMLLIAIIDIGLIIAFAASENPLYFEISLAFAMFILLLFLIGDTGIEINRLLSVSYVANKEETFPNTFKLSHQ